MLSIVIPAYNVEPYIGVALTAALAQPRSTEIEFIVVDDGSTDATLEQVLRVKASAPEHTITVIRQENRGVSAARNAGIAHSTSRYIGFLDSDDEWAPDFTQIAMPLLDDDVADIIEFNVGIVDSNGRVIDSLRIVNDESVGLRSNDTTELLEFARICEVHCYARIYRRDLWDGVEFPVGHVYEDSYAIPLVYTRARALYGIREEIYCYRRRAGSITQTITLRSVECVAHFAVDALQKSRATTQKAFWLALFHKFFANQCFLASRVDAAELPAAMNMIESTAATYQEFADQSDERLPKLRFRRRILVSRRVFQLKSLVKRTLGLQLRPPEPPSRRIEVQRQKD
jgi:glycosyltransferase involved in cell wall biosynthesis